MKKEDISQIRREFNHGSFSEKDAADSPYDQFQAWFDDAKKVEMLDPNAMTICTVSESNAPSARVVLLKSYDEKGFVFFSNYESQKGSELEKNPNIAALFYWDKLDRQIKIEGKAVMVSHEESDAYFQTRSYTSKVGAWASKQSRKLKSRFTLLREVATIMAKYPVNVPLPPHWGGYRIEPLRMEFWQGRESRLHDRVEYVKSGSLWVKSRLYP
jgi:pyridoxamine 5'-phosphate oxidase